MREAPVEAAFVREGKRRGCWVLKGAIMAFAGFPDRLVLAPRARVGFCELKRPGGEARPLQRAIHRRLRRLGFQVEVIDRPEDVAGFYDRLLA